MKRVKPILLFSVLILMASACLPKEGSNLPDNFFTVSSIRNVMWKGQLGPQITMDTLSWSDGLYGLGPESYLKGEILIDNGETYVSRVTKNESMQVLKTKLTSAPFFVYSKVDDWYSIPLPSNVKTIEELERFIDVKTKTTERPFAFKLVGDINSGKIHIQNLPEGTQVSSPKEAHQGQVNYALSAESVKIIGVFSTEHQGIFTHHDSYLHLHLITADNSKMGHLDDMDINQMILYLPKK